MFGRLIFTQHSSAEKQNKQKTKKNFLLRNITEKKKCVIRENRQNGEAYTQKHFSASNEKEFEMY